MTKIKKEVKIGLLITGALFIFIWGVNYLKGTDIFTKHIVFYSKFDNTSGLIETNPISISGVKVGHVDKMFLHPDGSGKVVVKCIVEKQIEIPENSTARLFSSSIVGSRQIEILLGDSEKLLSSGDTLRSSFKPSLEQELSNHLLPLKGKIESVVVKADTILNEMSLIFTTENRENISSSIANLQKSMQSIEQLTYIADTTFLNSSVKIANIINNFESMSEDMATLSDSLQKANIAETMENANKSLESFSKVMKKIEDGEGSAGMLVQDDSLYYNLSRSSHELELLLEDIRKNPSRYFNISVFGR